LDYTGLVITEVLNEAHWAEEASTDPRKRAELVTELFNSVMADNSAKAVYTMYPLVYEQVTPPALRITLTSSNLAII
jgi:hypothetical protein